MKTMIINYKFSYQLKLQIRHYHQKIFQQKVQFISILNIAKWVLIKFLLQLKWETLKTKQNVRLDKHFLVHFKRLLEVIQV